MRTTALILNWNTLGNCREFLRSIAALGITGVEFIVIDNASSEPGVDGLPGEFPGVSVLKMDANLGFTGAFNRGIRVALESGAEVVVLLNPDLLFVENPFPPVWQALQADPKLGVVCPAIFNDRECRELYCLGWSVPALSNPYRNLEGREQPIVYPDTVLGCFMAVRREIFEKGVLFDERFYNYYEETDFCLRVRAAGYRIAVLPKVKIVHTKFAATGNYSPLKSYYQGRNLVLVCRKHARPGTVHFHILTGLMRHLAQSRRAPTAAIRKTVRRALWEGWWDGLLGRYGRARRYLREREQDYRIKGLPEQA